jgi:hypothetical protein
VRLRTTTDLAVLLVAWFMFYLIGYAVCVAFPPGLLVMVPVTVWHWRHHHRKDEPSYVYYFPPELPKGGGACAKRALHRWDDDVAKEATCTVCGALRVWRG